MKGQATQTDKINDENIKKSALELKLFLGTLSDDELKYLFDKLKEKACDCGKGEKPIGE